MKRKADYLPYVTIIAIVAVVAIVLLILNNGNLAGEATRTSTNSMPACIWIDRYSNIELDHTPLSIACTTAGLKGYVSVAYELRRDYQVYSAADCNWNKLIGQSSDHQMLKSYFGNITYFGEEVGNLDSCHQIGQSLNYETISQMYDGALCCKT